MRASFFQAAIQFARREIVLVAAFVSIALALWTFVHLADEVGEGETRGFDTALLLALRTGDHHDPIGPPWFEFAVRDVTALGGYAVLTLVTAIAAGFLAVRRNFGRALLLLVAVIGGALLSESLKFSFARPRPDLVAHIVEAGGASFPSGHATLSAAAYLTLGAMLARALERRRERFYVLGTAIFLALLIGASRVYLGVHWPTDVLAGWCVGGAWALLCWTAASWLERNDAQRA